MIADKLAEIPLFASLSKRDREQIARAADEVEVEVGKHLAEQGRFAYEFMAIEEGTADVIKDGEKLRELGPGDFFGEMEMRRLDKTSPRAERATLWLYWVVSGYGLRSLRALASLLVTIVLFAFLFRRFGFDPPVGYTRALLFSAESTSSLFRVPETSNTTLTQTGEGLQIALRLLGPLFFGLALLSLRGRVRR